MKLSVILPVNNVHQFLDLAISSLITQTFISYEILIIINGNNEEIREHIHSKYSKIKKIEILETKFAGLPFALNYGINAAKSNIIVRMDSDDICHPKRLERIYEYMSINKDIDILASNFYFINEYGKKIGNASNLPTNNKKIRRCLPYRSILPHPTIAIKKEILLLNGGYSYGSFSEDYDLWLRLRRNKSIKFGLVKDLLLEYRIHDSQLTSVQNIWKIFSFDISLKIREFLYTKDIAYLPAIVFTVIDLIYRYSKFQFYRIYRTTKKS